MKKNSLDTGFLFSLQGKVFLYELKSSISSKRVKSVSIFFLVVFSLLIHFPAYSQGNNALDFDGIDDMVEAPGASGLIANSYHLTLSCWVYPTNAFPSFPDFDGFAGFRNDVDADFYLLQVGSNAVEARFRNSAGSVFTITSNLLQLNTWQHYVLTYDSTMLRLYKDGQIADSLAADGNIITSNVNFLAGDVYYLGTDFFLQGKLDEVSLWNISLSSDEIKCIHLSPIDSLSAGLQLYYNCNQGIAGGNNTSVTILNDAKGQANGNILNFSLTGPTSNFIDGVISSTLLTDSICQGEGYQFGGQTLTISGSYYQTLSSSLGCDSVIQLNLAVTPVDTTVTQIGASLIASVTGATYQWIDCGNGNTIIPGAFINTYSPSVNGSYAVIITKNGCTDTSACHAVINVGLDDPGNAYLVSVYPTPVNDLLSIQFSSLQQNFKISITDLTGRMVFTHHYNSSFEGKIDMSALTKGIYFLTYNSADGMFIKKLIKN